MIEYRVCWEASSNASFHGATDWVEWGGFEESPGDVQDALYEGKVECQGLIEALEACGFGWHVEVREAAS